VRLEAQMSGGGQERGLRSGTLPHPIIAGFGAACELAGQELAHDHEHISRLANKLKTEIHARIPQVVVNGGAGGVDGNGYSTFRCCARPIEISNSPPSPPQSGA
jgi:cysteine sulfinate desulfinase/cysteine desulfurase-like protein